MPLRLILSLLPVAVIGYTGVVVARHGLDFLPVFFGDIVAMGWAGQFNLGFLCMLPLAALWVAWRHCFSAGGLALAVAAVFDGAPFLCVYLQTESARGRGDVRALLPGPRANDV